VLDMHRLFPRGRQVGGSELNHDISLGVTAWPRATLSSYYPALEADCGKIPGGIILPLSEEKVWVFLFRTDSPEIG